MAGVYKKTTTTTTTSTLVFMVTIFLLLFSLLTPTTHAFSIRPSDVGFQYAAVEESADEAQTRVQRARETFESIRWWYSFLSSNTNNNSSSPCDDYIYIQGSHQSTSGREKESNKVLLGRKEKPVFSFLPSMLLSYCHSINRTVVIHYIAYIFHSYTYCTV